MKKLLDKWNYKKHAIFVGVVYSAIAVTGNALLHKKRRMDDANFNPIDYSRNMPKKQKVFNKIITSFFIVDMTLGYYAIKSLKKRLDS